MDSGRSGQSRVYPSSSSDPLGSPCPNLTFIGKSIHRGGPLPNFPENTPGEGQRGRGHNTETPSSTSADKISSKGRSAGPRRLLTSKAIIAGNGKSITPSLPWTWRASNA